MASRVELQLPKGMRDRDSADKILQLHVLDTIRTVFELYGYAPLETPVVERMDILTAKFAAGEGTDVMKEIFQVTDQGERELGLRYDHTVPLCRYVAMNPTVKMPYKRYDIGKVFRDGPIKLGRYREFWQADADIVGVPGVLGDCEGIMIADDVFKRLELEVTIKIGSREILNAMMEHLQLDTDLRPAALIALDKLEKIGPEGVLAEMKEAGIPVETAQSFIDMCALDGSNEERLAALETALGSQEGITSMREVLTILKALDTVVFDPTLARGLQYYTGITYECTLNTSKITSSLIGSGRYDKMIGAFMGGKKDIPATGMSFGVSVICDALREKGLGEQKSLTHVYIAPISDNEQAYALEIAQMLRSAGVNTDMDLIGKSPGKNFAYADALGIPYVVIVGEDEQAARNCSLKDMRSGDQQDVELDQLLAAVSA